jgi:peptidyl-prolyl cis-trans isomerase A (cyclophilin A)
MNHALNMILPFTLYALMGISLSACTASSYEGRSSIVAATTENEQKDKKQVSTLSDGIYAHITTRHGTIVIKLEHEKAPMTVANFVGLAEGKVKNTAKPEGTPYFDGIKFHRVIANFMIQGGDPTGTGMSGPGYAFADEIHPELKHDRPGTLSMANAGPATNGSQFFITHGPTPHLDGRHAVFGYVVSGQEVVNAVQQNDAMESVRIERVGKAAKEWDATKVLAANQDKFRASNR